MVFGNGGRSDGVELARCNSEARIGEWSQSDFGTIAWALKTMISARWRTVGSEVLLSNMIETLACLQSYPISQSQMKLTVSSINRA
jgi:hypothetical protein